MKRWTSLKFGLTLAAFSLFAALDLFLVVVMMFQKNYGKAAFSLFWFIFFAAMAVETIRQYTSENKNG